MYTCHNIIVEDAGAVMSSVWNVGSTRGYSTYKWQHVYAPSICGVSLWGQTHIHMYSVQAVNNCPTCRLVRL